MDKSSQFIMLWTQLKENESVTFQKSWSVDVITSPAKASMKHFIVGTSTSDLLPTNSHSVKMSLVLQLGILFVIKGRKRVALTHMLCHQKETPSTYNTITMTAPAQGVRNSRTMNLFLRTSLGL